ncbi:MAG: DUF29 domain-containing protein [Halochromatium sp.]|nr:DUF29 domain-containing protein [Halochromatium sp.]
MSDLKALYETDYSTWAKRHMELLRDQRFAELDIDHLLEELSDMSKSERRELASRLLILIAHLLKWEYQYPLLSERWREFDGRSWRVTIVEQRKQLAVLLRQSPGLRSKLSETITAAYPDAVDLASKETQLPPETFPEHCAYTSELLLDDDFFPAAPGTAFKETAPKD